MRQAQTCVTAEGESAIVTRVHADGTLDLVVFPPEGSAKRLLGQNLDTVSAAPESIPPPAEDSDPVRIDPSRPPARAE